MAKTLETAPATEVCRFVRLLVRGVVVREASNPMMQAESSFFVKAVLDGIAGAVAGGVLGAVITVAVDGRRKRREVSMKILERMVTVSRDIAQVNWQCLRLSGKD